MFIQSTLIQQYRQKCNNDSTVTVIYHINSPSGPTIIEEDPVNSLERNIIASLLLLLLESSS